MSQRLCALILSQCSQVTHFRRGGRARGGVTRCGHRSPIVQEVTSWHTTRSRPRGREHARPSTGGTAAEHATKIYTVAIVGIVVIVAFLALTSVGHVIDAATQHFMLFYAGVFALIGLCASVGLGLVATDRMFLNPGHRVFIQSAHRAASFGAVTFLIIHIITEILAQRVHVLDAVVPFLSPFRTFYIGLGTIASDLIILLVITGIMRGRFNANGKAWRWRAIHYTSYASFVFGVWHGLLGGRPGKPYVDWSYGFLVALVLLGLAVRVLSNSLRPKENLSAPPVDMSASSASAPLRAAAMFAQLGVVARRLRLLPRLRPATGGQPVMSAPLSAPVLTAAARRRPPAGDQGQPFYEPGYEGPPRYLGAPRAADSGPMPRAGTGPMPRAATGPMPRAGTGPMPRAGTGPMPRAATGPLPRLAPGPCPGQDAVRCRGRPARCRGPELVRCRASGSGPMPRAASGPMPRARDRSDAARRDRPDAARSDRARCRVRRDRPASRARRRADARVRGPARCRARRPGPMPAARRPAPMPRAQPPAPSRAPPTGPLPPGGDRPAAACRDGPDARARQPGRSRGRCRRAAAGPATGPLAAAGETGPLPQAPAVVRAACGCRDWTLT